jgi:hypothetical protein
MLSPENLSSRRNLIRMGVVVASRLGVLIIASSAVLARTGPAAAERFRRGDNDGDADDGGRHHHCFLKGTVIRTMQGDKKIEDLIVGDLLPTVFGGGAPIKSITRQRLGTAVKIARSALGPDVPNQDLYVSSPHALLIDGTLVAAGSLLNGTTITEPLNFDDFESFNVVLEQHNVIYANGAPCESLLGPGEQPCAPRPPYGWRRGLIKSHLRSAVAPWIDRRQPVDIIRDGLDARGTMLLHV